MILNPFGGVKNTKKITPPDFRLFATERKYSFFLNNYFKILGEGDKMLAFHKWEKMLSATNLSQKKILCFKTISSKLYQQHMMKGLGVLFNPLK